MKLSIGMIGQIYAAGRNYINLILGFCTSLGLLSVTQSKTLTESFAEVYQGISLIAHGFTSIWQVLVVVGGPLVGAIVAWWASRSAKPENQAASLVAQAQDPTNPVKQEAAKVAVSNAAVLAGAEKVVNPSIADNPATLPAVTKA